MILVMDDTGWLWRTNPFFSMISSEMSLLGHILGENNNITVNLDGCEGGFVIQRQVVRIFYAAFNSISVISR